MAVRPFVSLLLLLLAAPLTWAQPVTVTPWAPTAADVILVNVFLVSYQVTTQSHSVSGGTVTVSIANDGFSFDPNPPGVATEPVGPLPPGTYTFIISVQPDGEPIATFPVVVSPAPPALLRPAVEYFNAALGHYFMTADPGEIQDLDTGVHVGWSRTGYSFSVNDNATGGDKPVCRFYIPPIFGDSHFFSVFQSECDALQFALLISYPPYFAGYIYESPNVFYVGVPDRDTGACAPGYDPVYRLWNNRADSNHRYTTNIEVKTEMIAKGWVPEGYGANAVAMCSPR